jgi:hypothetical protein
VVSCLHRHASLDSIREVETEKITPIHGTDNLHVERKFKPVYVSSTDFESFGSKGECPQRFGKSGLLIPDGMIGTHTVYQERWRFEIHHTAQAVPGSDAVCITWKIINVKTGFCLAKTETPEEAEARVSLGWTISSRLFREALTHRANELEGLLNGETNQCRIANLKSLIKALRPKTFTQGPLVFGLKHKIVQEKIGNALI